MSEQMSVPEAAVALGVSERTIWRWLKSGRLSGERPGDRVLVSMPSDQPGHKLAEAWTPYAVAGTARSGRLEVGPWPYTAENVEKRKAILAAQRRRAADDIERLGSESRPDPDGLTGVDYVRELRGPIGADVDTDDGPIWRR